jgi:uncharacterized membrane protein YfcA
MWEWISFALIGCFAGISAGLLGLGGGLVIVPSLLLVFSFLDLPSQQAMHIAVATSLMTITITSLSATIAHQHHQHINWGVVKNLTPGLIFGGVLGAFLTTLITGPTLQTCFALYVLIVATRMWWPATPSVDTNLIKTPLLMIVGSFIGIVSALVGIGGGSLTVPYLVMAKQSIKHAIGTAAACGFPISIAAVTGFVIFGQNNVTISDSWLVGYIHWQAFWGIVCTSIIFAPLGAKLAKRLPVDALRRVFSIALIMVAASLIMVN